MEIRHLKSVNSTLCNECVKFCKYKKKTLVWLKKGGAFISPWFSYVSAEGERGTAGGKRLDSNTFGTRF